MKPSNTHHRPDRAARMAQNFEKMNADRGDYWDDLPVWARVILMASAAVSVAIIGTLLGLFLTHIAIITLANMSDPFAGSPY